MYVLAFKNGNLKKAKHFYNLILKKTPNQSDANHNLGILLASLGQLDKAEILFQTALQASADREQFWLSYIKFLIANKKFTKAEIKRKY